MTKDDSNNFACRFLEKAYCAYSAPACYFEGIEIIYLGVHVRIEFQKFFHKTHCPTKKAQTADKCIKGY